MTNTETDAEAVERLEHAGRGMLLAWWARRKPAAPAIAAPAGDRTFAELNGRANQVVRSLRRLGLRAGDGVALLCSNRAEFAEVAAACQRAGWRLTTINRHLTPDEAGYVVDDCEANALVADASLGPDEEWGERVVGVVELQPGQEGSPDLAAELVEHFRARLAHFKCPQVVEFIDELPRQDNGKIYKRLLRERVRSGRGGTA
jgi:acyl-CoA synthetase (AMP-forming)/AMP-acid ligase II